MAFNGKNVVVTGGAGFIGSNLVDDLVKMGNDVTVVDDLSYGKQANLNKNAKFLKIDVRDFETLKAAIADSDVVYHLAAVATTKESQMGWKDPYTDFSINAVGTLNVLKAIVDTKSDPRFVYTSTAAVYGEPLSAPISESHPNNPQSPYGISKLAGEKYTFAFGKEYGVKYTILRIFNSYGPRQPRYIMADIMNKLKSSPKVLEVLGTGNQIRDYIYISDTVKAFLLAGEKPEAVGGIFNVGSGKPTTIKELVNKLVTLFDLDGKIEVKYTNKSWTGDMSVMLADTKKIESVLGFKTDVDVESGLKSLKDWILTN